MVWKTPTVTIRGNKFDAYQLDAYWKGMEDEQDRIIKLLEADLCTNSEWGWTECYGLNKEHCEHLKGYLKLIKGEDDE